MPAMSPGSSCLVLFSLLLAVPTNPRLLKKKQLTVGYMTAIKGELKDRQGLAVSGALALALEEVRFFLLVVHWLCCERKLLKLVRFKYPASS